MYLFLSHIRLKVDYVYSYYRLRKHQKMYEGKVRGGGGSSICSVAVGGDGCLSLQCITVEGGRFQK